MLSSRQLLPNYYSMTKHSFVEESCHLRRGSRRGYNADIEEDNPRHDYSNHYPAARPKAHVENENDDDDDDVEEGSTIHIKHKNDNPTTNTTTTTTGNIQFYSHIKPKRRYYRHKDDNSTSRHQCPSGQRQSFSSNKKHKKRPHYWKMIHPDIDLSLVSLFSSRELDQRTTTTTTTPDGRGGGGDAIAGFSTIPTTTTATCSSSSLSTSSSSSDTTVHSRNKMERTTRTLKDDDREGDFSSEDVITKARPLAVVDYGSIELDMSGSLLDSIYKIGPPPPTTRSSTSGWGKKEKKKNDGAILYTDTTMIGEGGGGGRKRHGIPFSHTNYEPIRCKNRRISWREDQIVDTASPDSNVAHGSTNSISSFKVDDASCAAVQVHATSSSRSLGSNHPRCTMTTTATETPTTISRKEVVQLSPSSIISTTKMVHAGRRVCGPLPTISMVPTTLEAAISFSPYARVLFCAHPPYTVVHTNAAYVSLSQQRSLTKPCSVGGAFSNTCSEQLEGESSEIYVARMVMEHMQTLDPDDNDDDVDEEVSRARKPPRPGLFYYIYPVLSTEDLYSQFLRGYRHDFERRRQGMIKKTETSITTNNSAVLRDAEAAATSSILACTSILHVPRAVEPDRSLATKNESITSPIQYRTQYLLQIEPDCRYPY